MFQENRWMCLKNVGSPLNSGNLRDSYGIWCLQIFEALNCEVQTYHEKEKLTDNKIERPRTVQLL